MALASKGTRRMAVDGVAYRWVVAPDDEYMVLVVERADDPGQRLEASFRACGQILDKLRVLDNPVTTAFADVTPSNWRDSMVETGSLRVGYRPSCPSCPGIVHTA